MHLARGFAPLIGILVISALIVAALLYFGFPKLSEKLRGNYIDNLGDDTPWVNKASPPPTPNETVYTEESRSANWKTYTGKYFTFNYPSTWTNNTGPASNYPENLEVIGLRIGIAVFEADYKNYSYEKGIEMNKDRKSQSLKVNGREATKFEYVGKGDVLPADYSIISVVVRGLDDKSYLIGFNGPRKDITDELTNQILSTFRFTN